MKKCYCESNECKGNVQRYSIHSHENDKTYPNRFWGIVDYCENHKEEDIAQGFLLNKAYHEETTYIL